MLINNNNNEVPVGKKKIIMRQFV